MKSFDCPCAPLDYQPPLSSLGCMIMFPGATSANGQGPDEHCPHRARYVCASGPRCPIAYHVEAANLCVEHAEICPTCGRAFCETCFADHQAECAKPVRMYEGRTISNLLEMVNRRFKE